MGYAGSCLSRDTALIDEGATHPSALGIFDVPTAIGPYSIIRVLGEGGMGIVYLAEQAEPFRREVALKVIKIGMDTREVVRAFRSRAPGPGDDEPSPHRADLRSGSHRRWTARTS